MSARIPPGSAEIWIQFNLAGDPEAMYCSLGVELAVGQAANQTATDNVLNAATASVRPVVSSDLTVGPGHMIWGQDGGDLRIDGTASPLAGTGAAGAVPVNTGLLVRKLTASGGRRNRGRMTIPGLPEGNVGGTGGLTTAFHATAVTAMNDLMADLIATSEVAALLLFHDTSPFTPTTITALEPQTKAATQRRRMRP